VDALLATMVSLDCPSHRSSRARASPLVAIITAPGGLREQLAARKTLTGKATLCARLRPDHGALESPTNAAKFALRSLAGRIALLTSEITQLDVQLSPLVAAAAPRTTAFLGISTGHAGQLLLTAGQNINRIHSESSFAALCGASPITIASGKHARHRLNPGGDRRANRRPARDRCVPPSLPPSNTRLRHTTHQRRKDQERDHPLPQALHRLRGLRHPARRPQITPRRPLTSIGTSQGGSPRVSV